MQIRNSVTLIGNVGQNPSTTTLPSGTRVIEFSFATNDSYRNRDGEKITRTEWHTIKAYGKVVDVLDRYVTKGTQLALTGAIRYRKWTDKHDQNRTTAEIVLETFTFLGSKNSDSYQESEVEESMTVAEPTPKKTYKRRKKAAKAAEVTPAEDLPF